VVHVAFSYLRAEKKIIDERRHNETQQWSNPRQLAGPGINYRIDICRLTTLHRLSQDAVNKKPADLSTSGLFLSRQRPTFPLPHGSSIIGLGGLNFRVRDGMGVTLTTRFYKPRRFH